ELTDVRRDLRRDVLEDVVRGREPFAGSLLAEDRDAGLEVRRLDVRDEAPLEPGPQAVLEAVELLRRDVRGDDDLLVRVVQGVERVEVLLHRLFLALQELDVVDEEDVDLAVAALERASTTFTDRVDEVVRELFGVDVPHAHAGVEALRVVTDRVEQ